MAVQEDTIREALKQVVDPELFVNVIDLGLVYAIKLEEVDGKTNIGIDMTLTSPACPAGPQLVAQSKQVLGALEGVGEVDVKLVMTPPWTPDRMTEFFDRAWGNHLAQTAKRSLVFVRFVAARPACRPQAARPPRWQRPRETSRQGSDKG
jgi:metal-sulfur cluster biosynthetic enzyme